MQTQSQEFVYNLCACTVYHRPAQQFNSLQIVYFIQNISSEKTELPYIAYIIVAGRLQQKCISLIAILKMLPVW